MSDKYFDALAEDMNKRMTELENKLEANLKARLPDADWKTVNENFVKMSVEIEEQESKRIKGWGDYKFLQESQIKRQDYLDERIEKLEVRSAAHTEKTKKLKILFDGNKLLIDEDNDSILKIYKELSELRNQIQNNAVADLNHYEELKHNQGILMGKDIGMSSVWSSFNKYGNQIYEIKKVLRDLFKKFEDSHDEAINRRFFTKLLDKLGGEKGKGSQTGAKVSKGDGTLIDPPTYSKPLEERGAKEILESSFKDLAKITTEIMKEKEPTDAGSARQTEFKHIDFRVFESLYPKHKVVEKADLEFLFKMCDLLNLEFNDYSIKNFSEIEDLKKKYLEQT